MNERDDVSKSGRKVLVDGTRIMASIKLFILEQLKHNHENSCMSNNEFQGGGGSQHLCQPHRKSIGTYRTNTMRLFQPTSGRKISSFRKIIRLAVGDCFVFTLSYNYKCIMRLT